MDIGTTVGFNVLSVLFVFFVQTFGGWCFHRFFGESVFRFEVCELSLLIVKVFFMVWKQEEKRKE